MRAKRGFTPLHPESQSLQAANERQDKIELAEKPSSLGWDVTGFTLVEIMIVVGIIAALAALAMPNLLRAKMTANESMTQASLKVIVTGQVSYRISHDNYATIGELQPYVDDTLATGTKSGYTFFCAPAANTFVATAVPVSAATGVTHYCITEDGVIRVDPAIITSTDHDTCIGYGSI